MGKRYTTTCFITLLVFSFVFALSLAPIHAADGTATINFNTIVVNNYFGAGLMWDPADTSIPEFTTAQWNMIFSRVDFMKAKFARVMINNNYYCTGIDGSGNPQYNWNATGMARLYKILDYCQSNGITVMFGEWWKPSWAGSFNDSRYMRTIGDCLNYLRNTKGYTCIKYYNFLNEPNGDWMYGSGAPDINTRWNNWSSGVSALYTELNNRGYTSWIKICGPDTAYQDDWVEKTVDSLATQVGQIEFHIYKDYDTQVSVNGEIESVIKQKRSYMNSHGQSGRLLWLGELGMKQGRDPNYDCQPRVVNFDYGVLMADAMVQAMRGGANSALPWDLDDAMHLADYNTGVLKKWGMWNTLGGQTVGSTYYPPGDTNLRPWYYTMSLFSRLFPSGCQVVDVGGPNVSQVRVTAARMPNGSNWDLSVAIVNDSTTARSIVVQLPGVTNTATFKQYNYFNSDRPTDGNGFPVPKTDVLANIANGITISLPGQGVVFLTTTYGGTPISFGAAPTPTPIGTNLALNKPATCSSTDDATRGAAMAVDGNGTTRWASTWAVDPQWIYVDLGNTYSINRVRLNWEAAYGRSYNIQVSADAANWTNVYTTTTGDGGMDDVTFTATNARYVRMYGTVRALSQYGYSLWDFEVYGSGTPTATKTPTPTVTPTPTPTTTPGSGNLALNKTANASSFEGTGYEAGKAFDGNTGTRWSSAYSDNQSIWVDLGSNQTVAHVKLRWESAYAKSYQIQTSTDGSTWTTVADDWAATGGTVDKYFTARTARYVKLYCITRATSYGFSLWEFEVYAN